MLYQGRLHNISLYVEPIDSNIDAIFEDNNIMFITNDDGDYYIPENDVNPSFVFFYV